MGAIPATYPPRVTPPADVNPSEHFQQLRQVLIENDNLFGPRRVISVVRACELLGTMDLDPDSPSTGWLDDTYIALAIGAETSSAEVLTELARLDEALTAWNTVPAVADFRTAMKDTVLRQV